MWCQVPTAASFTALYPCDMVIIGASFALSCAESMRHQLTTTILRSYYSVNELSTQLMKRTRHTDADGLGTVAIIAIVAALAIGGAVAYQVSTTNRVEVDLADDMNEEATSTTNAMVRADISARIDTLKQQTVALVEDLREELNLDGALETSTDVFADIRADITDLYAEADAEARAELDELREHIDAAEAEIKAEGEETAGAMREALADIAADIEASLDRDTDTPDESDAATSTDDSADVEADGSVNGSVRFE